MDLTKLKTGDKVVSVSGLLLFVFGFLPWYGIEGFNFNAWDYFFVGVIPVLIGVVMVAQVLAARLGNVDMPNVGSLTWGQIHLILGSIAAALVVIKLIVGSSASTLVSSIDLDRKYGIFLAAIAAIGLAVGGFLKMQEDKAGGGSTPPPAPPAA
jgi:predicted permease